MGLSLYASSTSDDRTSSSLLLSCGAALSFAEVDIAYVWRDRISPVYLADAAVELAIAGLMLRS